MLIEKEINRDISWILKKIKKIILLEKRRTDLWIEIEQSSTKDIPAPDIQRKIICNLHKLGAIKIITETVKPELIVERVDPSIHPILSTADYYDNRKIENIYIHNISQNNPEIIHFDVLQPKFNKIYKNYDQENGQQNKQLERNRDKTKITNIIIVKPKNPDCNYKLVINEDYKNAKDIRKSSNLFSVLIKTIEYEEPVMFDKKILDYFNSNKKCPLYSDEKYKLIKILKTENDGRNKYLIFNPAIKKEVITEHALIRRIKKSNLA